MIEMAASLSCAEIPSRHLIQFYSDLLPLGADVSRYLAEGLRQGELAVVIATADHRAAFERGLREESCDVSSLVNDRRLIFCDAPETLSLFMIDGQPDRDRFDATVGTLIRELHTRARGAGLRAYGEMVDVLWNAGHSAAAIRLEQFWNELLSVNGFSLLCAYQVDIFGNEFQTGILDPVLRAHTHLVPARSNGDLGGALKKALLEVLGSRAESLPLPLPANSLSAGAAMPRPEATILWIRNHLPDYADEILGRAKRYCRS